MKKYIAIFGSANSGIKTLEDCKAWAANNIATARQTGKAPNTRCFICEVMEEVRVPVPEIEVVRFHPDSIKEFETA